MIEFCEEILFIHFITEVQQSLAATLPPVKLFSQQCYFELDPKKLELSYFSHSNAIFPPSYTKKQRNQGEKRRKQRNWGEKQRNCGKNSITRIFWTQQRRTFTTKNKPQVALFSQLHYFKIAQDIYYSKPLSQATLSSVIFVYRHFLIVSENT